MHQNQENKTPKSLKLKTKSAEPQKKKKQISSSTVFNFRHKYCQTAELMF